MPTINETLAPAQEHNFVGEMALVTWTPLLNADDGRAVRFTEFADKCFQVQGTFGVGGNVRIEGSNDGVNWFPLSNPLGTAINLTAAGIVQVLENPLFVRPRVTAGDGTTSITVIMLARRGRI